jgi:hypothetical protein
MGPALLDNFTISRRRLFVSQIDFHPQAMSNGMRLASIERPPQQANVTNVMRRDACSSRNEGFEWFIGGVERDEYVYDSAHAWSAFFRSAP